MTPNFPFAPRQPAEVGDRTGDVADQPLVRHAAGCPRGRRGVVGIGAGRLP